MYGSFTGPKMFTILPINFPSELKILVFLDNFFLALTMAKFLEFK